MADRPPRGRPGPVRDPAAAIAMAKCWLSTWTRRATASGVDMPFPGADKVHPVECGFCDMPRDMIIEALEEFQAWSGISSFESTIPLRGEIEAWNTLPANEQERLVFKAAGVLILETDGWDT